MTSVVQEFKKASWEAKTVTILCMAWVGLTLGYFDYFPSQDGPSHVYNAWVLNALNDGGNYSKFYVSWFTLVPNVLGTAVLVAFTAIVGAVWAEKLLLALIVIGFCSGYLFMLRQVKSQTPPVALLGPMLVLGYPLHMGFYSFSLGLALLPFVWGLAWRGRAQVNTQIMVSLGLLTALGYLAHIAVVGLMLAGTAVILLMPGTSTALMRRAQLLATCTPAAAGVMWFVSGFSTTDAHHWSGDKLFDVFVSMRAIASYIGTQEVVASAFGALLLGLVVTGLVMRRVDEEQRVWLAVAGVCGLVYVVLPDGGSVHWFLSERLSLVVWIALMPLVSIDRFIYLQRVWFISAVLLMMFTGFERQNTIDAELKSYVELGTSIERESTVLSLDFTKGEFNTKNRFRPFVHAAGWYGVTRNAIDVGNYEAQTNHFQTRLKPHVKFPDHNQVSDAPTSLDLVRFSPQIKYIVVKSLYAGAPQAFINVLNARYAISRASSNGKFTLYQRKN